MVPPKAWLTSQVPREEKCPLRVYKTVFELDGDDAALVHNMFHLHNKKNKITVEHRVFGAQV